MKRDFSNTNSLKVLVYIKQKQKPMRETIHFDPYFTKERAEA